MRLAHHPTRYHDVEIARMAHEPHRASWELRLWGDERSSTVNSDKLAAVAELLDRATHRAAGNAVLDGQFCLTWQASVRRDFPGIYVCFDIYGHLDGHGYG